MSGRAVRCCFGFAVAAVGVASLLSAAAHPLPNAPRAAIAAPIIVALGGKSGLEYWTLAPHGSRTPTAIAGTGALRGNSAFGIAANGSELVVPNGAEVALFNLQTGALATIPDPGEYAADAAIGKDGTAYVSNFSSNGSNVFVIPPGGAPYTVTCGLKGPDYIAVDNEGDVFLNDAILNAVVELPRVGGRLDATRCSALKLVPRESGYSAGIAIDPKTDDLLVLDDPDECAGGVEGRLAIHSKPYTQGTARVVIVGENCSSGVRLDATSSTVFVGDGGVAGGYSFILQRSYPGGKSMGVYGGGNPGGNITVPNTLPN